MSVVNLMNKVPAPILAGILKKMDLKFSDLKNVGFSFVNFGGAAGTTVTSMNSRNHDILGYHINIDETITKDKKYTRYGGVYGTLVHELQHLKQSLSGRHVPDTRDENFAFWDDKRYPTEDSIRRNSRSWGMSEDAAFVMYRNLPWELDADAVSERVISELVAEGIVTL